MATSWRASEVLADLPRWKIALCVGVPLAVGGTAMFLYSRRNRSTAIKPEDSGTQTVKTEPAEQKQQTPLEKAQGLKNKGNKYFKAGQYEKAIECYSDAIKVCPTESTADLSTFHQNRAAAYEQLKRYDKVIEDCTDALTYNRKYTKALNRRAKARESTGKLMEALEDVTATCILENFMNQQSLLMAERILKELGRTKASKAYQNRKPTEPSKQYIRTYFSTFRNDPIMNSIERMKKGEELEKDQTETPEKEMIDKIPANTGEGNSNIQEEPSQSEQNSSKEQKPSPYRQALENMRDGEYSEIIKLCTKELDDKTSQFHAECLLLRGTFSLLYGEGVSAIQDFTELLGIPKIDKALLSNTLIKRGGLHMQNGSQTEALDDFARAVREDPSNSDIYHHRGQLNLLIDRVEDAVKDFEKSVELSPDFPIAFVQKCYTEYRLAFQTQSERSLQAAMENFEKALKDFSNCAEGFALYGQALCDQQKFDKADENFAKALEIEPENGNIYVHRGLLQLQWRQNVDEASRLISKALDVDDKCEFAYETLGTIEIQRGNVARAIELFDKAISLAKTEMEMAHLISLRDAAVAQANVAKTLGIQAPLGGMM